MEKNASILVVDDDKEIADLVEIYLVNDGYQVLKASDGEQCLQTLKEHPEVRMLILDIMMPELDGFSTCREIRKTKNIPVIMLSAKSEEVDKILGLNMGADDYVTKPYNPTILLLRIETILRRTEQTGRQSEQRASSVRGEKAEGEAVQEELQDEELRLNLLRSTVSYHGDEVVLSKNELAILHCLMSRKGQIVSRDELMDHLWDMSEFVDDNTLTVNINRLRKRLAQIGLENKIETRRGQGYLLL